MHGRPQIRAADPAKPKLLEIFDSTTRPIRSLRRISLVRPRAGKGHTEIECDPKVWNQVESLIYSKLAPETRDTASAIASQLNPP